MVSRLIAVLGVRQIAVFASGFWLIFYGVAGLSGPVPHSLVVWSLALVALFIVAYALGVRHDRATTP
jgi:uncharacterized membrane protein